MNANVPFAADVVDPTRGAGCRLQLDGHARKPELARLDLALHAAAGLEVAPDRAGDRARLRSPARSPAWSPSGSASAGCPSARATPSGPVEAGDFRTMPVDDVPVTLGPEGSASDSAPGGQIASCTAPIAALTAPCDGSFWYITCQITPAANSDTAIGMNTAVLNATDHAMRSVSTANTSPIAVTSRGHDGNPDRVVLDRLADRRRREQRVVVVEPDEVIAGAIEEAPLDRGEHRVDDPDAQDHERRTEERGRDQVPAEPALVVGAQRSPRCDRGLRG